MAAITAKMVAELRGKTDAPMMECKKALTEAEGNMDKAEEILRVKLGNKASKKSGRIAAEGTVAAFIDGTVATLLEINCETDFVSQNETFQAYAESLAKITNGNNPDDVAALSAMELQAEGFGPTVEDVRKGLIGKIGENMTIRRFQRISNGNPVTSYLHGTRIGVLVEYTGDETAARDVAMHIAAMKPAAMTRDDVAPELIERERSIAAAKAEESGKPAEIVTKMVDGAVNKFLKEVSLMDQSFVKNDKQTVAQMLKEKDTEVKSYVMFVVGEGIERKADNFADEVAATVAAAKS